MKDVIQIPLETPTENTPNCVPIEKLNLENSKATQRALSSINCPVELAIRVIGGKWKPVIIWHLRENKKRFGELKREIKGITVKMLAQQLRELEQDGILDRKMFFEVPPKVEYSLTPLGRELDPVLTELYKWGMALRKQIIDDSTLSEK